MLVFSDPKPNPGPNPNPRPSPESDPNPNPDPNPSALHSCVDDFNDILSSEVFTQV